MRLLITCSCNTFAKIYLSGQINISVVAGLEGPFVVQENSKSVFFNALIIDLLVSSLPGSSLISLINLLVLYKNLP